jgi:heme-binding NEAT domain protein
MCWSPVPVGSPLTPFMTLFPDATVAASPQKTALTANGTLTGLAAGNYNIGFGFKNKSSNTNLSANDYMIMSYQVIHK